MHLSPLTACSLALSLLFLFTTTLYTLLLLRHIPREVQTLIESHSYAGPLPIHTDASHGPYIICDEAVYPTPPPDCSFDLLMNGWVPNPCFDEAMHEFHTKDKNFDFFADLHGDIVVTQEQIMYGDPATWPSWLWVSEREHNEHYLKPSIVLFPVNDSAKSQCEIYGRHGDRVPSRARAQPQPVLPPPPIASIRSESAHRNPLDASKRPNAHLNPAPDPRQTTAYKVPPGVLQLQESEDQELQADRAKQKCSEAKPACGNCLHKELDCVYPPPPEETRLQKYSYSSRSTSTSPSPSLSTRLAATPFTADDLRFWHHFLVDARPHLPFGDEATWLSTIPAFAHDVRPPPSLAICRS
ncbi:Zn(II)2Cys6 transcription factor domain-containing protein [Aspergillus mulundensis]|uniref:Zn(2)-C6 fungal-type domain-containing protein n=1 Tax=Aspergillus mulundensis TaxID=1810919 RepID=A0A3D8SCH4_9EURO|nr:hypothetical protein DSM5745_04352 [Aspergillus mulundensis]RDW84026.1 hypothetical protein DSM5745_04352 [Aspergillus mulundensis]